MVTIRPVLATDADLLFPLIHRTSVTDTLIYDGPESREEFRDRIGEFVQQMAAGKRHLFTIVVEGAAAGNVGIRPYADGFRGDIGIWIGIPFQRRGVGTKAIRLVSEYGFDRLALDKIEALVYVGNQTSRRAFEKTASAWKARSGTVYGSAARIATNGCLGFCARSGRFSRFAPPVERD